MYYTKVFQIRIAGKRKELNISQNQVSADTEINQTDISKYENGKLEPTLEKLGKLAEYYQVSTDWLLGCQYNGKEGNMIKTALKELCEQIHETVRGSFYQGGTKEDIENMIHNLIENDLKDIAEKYKIDD